ncbi:PspC domain-containing protein [Solitalea lacus]|uniref:PspC domain-containing protein n=1 Tax=Solitalea lacus TaxID=2911172 RepID=UPI001EDB5EDE|nr:PspC domain-containing protein [Solitalea lacus]UKJ07699.1 PspC domain-containing protein [Solitalea lacus]
MNKTIIINISGIIFHIEEDAYDVLKSYMNDIKRHFSASTDSFEIITDIENRIAELFTERLTSDNKQVIFLADVEEVINKMGKVSDFDPDTETTQTPNGSTSMFSEDFPKVKRRLFRDTDNQIIGGVCSGVANYMEIDPTWVRLIWALLTITWGFGLIIYIILWLAVPEAKTVADKMAMKGEAATLASIKKAANDKINEVKSNSGLKSFFNSFFEVLGSILKWGLKAFVIFIGVVIILSAIAALLAIFTGSTALVFSESFGLGNFPPLNFIAPAYRIPLWLSVFFLVLVPSIFIIWLGVKVIFNRSFLNKTVGFSMLAIWVIALFAFAVYAGKSAASFKEEASIRQTIDLTPVKNNTWYLLADDKKWLTSNDSIKFNITLKSGKSIAHYSDDFDFDEVNLKIERSPDNKPHLIKIYKSKGKNFDNAIENSQNILYNYLQKDSTLTFNRHYELKNNGLWRVQEVELILQLPLNSKIIADQKMSSIMRDPYFYECEDDNSHHDHEDESSTKTWIVTENGIRCSNYTVSNSFERNPDLDETLKGMARDEINSKFSLEDENGTFDIYNQNVEEVEKGTFRVISEARIRKSDGNDEKRTYSITFQRKKDAQDPNDNDSWWVKDATTKSIELR